MPPWNPSNLGNWGYDFALDHRGDPKFGVCQALLRTANNQIEESLAFLEIGISEAERDTVDQELVMQALADFTEVFAEIKPYQQKELMRLVLHKAILGPDCPKIGLYGRPPEVRPLVEGDSRFQTLKWLPGLPSQSVVLWDCLALTTDRIARGQTKITVSG